MVSMINDITNILTLIGTIKQDELADVLQGLTTAHERQEFLKRLCIIELLKTGVSQHEVAKKLQVGIATVSRGYQEEKQKKFDGLFDCLPAKPTNMFSFGEHTLPRIFKGNWQLSGGFGGITRAQAIEDLIKYAQAGLTVLDTGDIYGESESVIGEFLKEYRKRCGNKAADSIHIHTKFVPDLDALQDLTFDDVRTTIMRSKKRLCVDTLDLVQFHWWDFTKGDFLQAARWLKDLQEQGHIRQIGLTNFACNETKMLLDAGIPIVSNQIQFSLFDPRALNGMLKLAQKHNMAIFCYGVLSGGLLEATLDSTNRSHVKYNLMVEEAGEAYHRKAIGLLESLAKKHHTTRSNIALAYALQTKGVSAVIVGPRNTRHLGEEKSIPNLSVDDYLSLRRLHITLQSLIDDDIYSFERNTDGAHGAIMKYNQNGMRQQ